MNNRNTITRHHYLNYKINMFNPSIINKCIETAMFDSNKRTFYPPNQPDGRDFKFRFSEPERFGMKVFKGKRYPLPYGLNGLKRVIHEIGSCSPIRRYEALNTLSDLLYDSLEYARALNEFDVVKRLEDAFFICIPISSGRASTFDLIVENLVIISSRFAGAKLMMKQYNLIDAIYEVILCQNTVSKLGSQILKNLSKFPSIAEEMIYYNHLGKLLSVFQSTPESNVDEDLFIHLSQMIYVDPVTAVNLGYFEFLLEKIDNQSLLLRVWTKCFALLLHCKEGQIAAGKHDVIKIFYELLNDMDNLEEDTIENVILTLQNATFTDVSLWRSREFWNFPNLLLRTAYSKRNWKMQLYSLQVLRNLTTMPSVKDYMRKVCKRNIIKIYCLSEASQKIKNELLMWLRKKCYVNIDEEKIIKCKESDKEK